MLVGWRGNLCLLSIPDIGHNLWKVESQLLTVSGQKFTHKMWWNLLLALPWLQDCVMALMWFYWRIWSRALLRNPCSLIYCPEAALHSVFILFFFFFFHLDESQFNKVLFPAWFLCHWLSRMTGCFFHGCENSLCKRFEIPQCTPRQATCARSDDSEGCS